MLSALYNSEDKKVMCNVRSVDCESGFTSSSTLKIEEILKPHDLFGVPLKNNNSVFPMLLDAQMQVNTHLARAAVVSCLANWPQDKVPLSSLGNVLDLVKLVSCSLSFVCRTLCVALKYLFDEHSFYVYR